MTSATKDIRALETITIHCPLCGAEHSYLLELERRQYIFYELPEFPMRGATRFVRRFSCPVKHEEFDASFVIHDMPSSPTRSVKVIGIVEGSSDKRKQTNVD
ncbi:MAG: hypothetical protein FJ243_01335 [Nitrospira sp.]|nr:hypothetical protein [Nitrospira sp.]